MTDFRKISTSWLFFNKAIQYVASLISKKCIFCNFYSTSNLELRKHNTQHFSITYSCVKCPFSSTKKANLNQHIRKCHSQEAQYKCTTCNYVCKTETNLDKHSARHERQLNYACLVCPNITSKYRRNILRHVKKKHAGLPLKPSYYIV